MTGPSEMLSVGKIIITKMYYHALSLKRIPFNNHKCCQHLNVFIGDKNGTHVFHLQHGHLVNVIKSIPYFEDESCSFQTKSTMDRNQISSSCTIKPSTFTKHLVGGGGAMSCFSNVAISV